MKGDLLGGVSGIALAAATQNVLGEAIKSAIAACDPAHADIGLAAGVLVCIMGGVAGARAVRRALRGASAGFWQTTIGRWLIGRMAGAAVALGLSWPVYAAVHYGLTQAMITLWKVGGIDVAIAAAPFYWPCIVALTGAIVWRLRTPAKVAIGKLSRPLRRRYREFFMGAGGSAAFAGICEEWANRWRPGLYLLGYSLFDRHWPVAVKDDRMLTVLAGTGGGKGDTCLTTNILEHKGSSFIIDVKGQLAALTADALRRKGKTVHVLDPFNVLGNGTARVDPMAGLDPEARDYIERLKTIVDAMVISTGERNRFFDDGARTLISCAIDFQKRWHGGQFKPPAGEEEGARESGSTLADAYMLITDPEFSDPESWMATAMSGLGGPARTGAALLANASGEALGNVMANTLANMSWIESLGMQETFGQGGFSPLEINNGKTAVFLVLPLEMLSVHQRALRLVVTMFVYAALQGRKEPGKASTLFVFDECFAIGKLDLLAQAAAAIRGFGGRCVFVWQGKGQADELYGRNSETFFSNSGQTQVFAINDDSGAKYVSDRIGKIVRWRKRAVSTAAGDRLEWEPSGAINLRDGPEINRMAGRAGSLQVVLNEGSDPFLLRRVSYRKLFRRDEYGIDPYEPPQETWAGKAAGAGGRLMRKLKGGI